MKQYITLIAIAAITSQSYAQHIDRNNSASCDSTCFASPNGVPSNNNYVMPGGSAPQVMQKTIPVYMSEQVGLVPNGTMVIRQTYLNNGSPYVEVVTWNKQYSLSNPKNKFTFNANNFNDITYVEVLNFDAGS